MRPSTKATIYIYIYIFLHHTTTIIYINVGSFEKYKAFQQFINLLVTRLIRRLEDNIQMDSISSEECQNTGYKHAGNIFNF